MQLPNRLQAYIPPEKLSAYLVSETHAVGSAKAKFFRSLGFDETNTEALGHGLLTIAHHAEVQDIVPTPHGVKYVLDGTLATSQGTSASIRTVWIVETGEENPRFVTAYPV
jgi:hypothetical protein